MLETELKHLSKSLNANIIQGESPFFEILEKNFQNILKETELSLRCLWIFCRKRFSKIGLEILMKIPYGQT